MSLGARIKIRRKALGLTAQFVASELNVASSTYFDWENERGIKGENYYEPLCAILRMSLTELITGKNRQDEIEKHVKIIEEQIKCIRKIL